MEDVYIALGSNLTSPVSQLQRAIDCISCLSSVKVIAVSRVYKSQPMGPIQPVFFNLVCLIKTSLLPLVLLDKMQQIELDLGRKPALITWGPRIIDIDLIYWQNKNINNQRLTIPHYDCWRRMFVLLPWLDVVVNDCLEAKLRSKLFFARPLAIGNGNFIGDLIKV